MNYQELKAKSGKQNAADWRQSKGGGWIHKTAVVENEDNIRDNSIVWGQVSGNARVSGDTKILGNAWVKPVLFLPDSRGHGCTNCKHGWLKIGCEEHTFTYWKEHFPAIARKHSLTPEEKIEYEAIVDLFCKIGI
jgi:hypothetical protein